MLGSWGLGTPFPYIYFHARANDLRTHGPLLGLGFGEEVDGFRPQNGYPDPMDLGPSDPKNARHI